MANLDFFEAKGNEPSRKDKRKKNKKKKR